MVTENQIIWWIDATGILHSCSQIASPPQQVLKRGLYAQGTLNPAIRAGTITHTHNQPATLSTIPRELFDALDKRFPHTRWWIPNIAPQPANLPKKPIPAHT